MAELKLFTKGEKYLTFGDDTRTVTDMAGEYEYLGPATDRKGNHAGFVFQGVYDKRLHVLSSSESREVFSNGVSDVRVGNKVRYKGHSMEFLVESVVKNRYVVISWRKLLTQNDDRMYEAVPWSKFIDRMEFV